MRRDGSVASLPPRFLEGRRKAKPGLPLPVVYIHQREPLSRLLLLPSRRPLSCVLRAT